MKVFVAILAILAVAFSQDAPLCNSGVNTESSSYNLGSLKKDNGYYSYTDAETGKIYIWNVCGSLDDYCGPNAAACISESGDLTMPEFTRAGSYDSFSYNIMAEDDDERIEVTFFGGDWCEAYQTNRSITFVYHCEQDYTDEPVFSDIDTSDDCENIKINIYTAAACGNFGVDEDSNLVQWDNYYARIYLHTFMIFVWIAVGLFSLMCCCACCAIIRRRRACQRSGKCGYQKVSQHVELTQPTVHVTAKPTAPVVNQSTQTPPVQYPYGMPVQYVPAPQYYYYMPQTQQQPPMVQLAPVTPEVTQQSQIDADEKLARELQAKFNHEV